MHIFSAKSFLRALKEDFSDEKRQLELIRKIAKADACPDSELFKFETLVKLICDPRIGEYMLLTAVVRRMEQDFAHGVGKKTSSPSARPHSDNEEEQRAEKEAKIKRLTKTGME